MRLPLPEQVQRNTPVISKGSLQGHACATHPSQPASQQAAWAAWPAFHPQICALHHGAQQAARVRCTVGEISDALERAWGRHAAAAAVAPGFYVAERGAGATGDAGAATAAWLEHRQLCIGSY